MKISKVVKKENVVKNGIIAGPGGTVRWMESIPSCLEFTQLDGKNDLLLSKDSAPIMVYGANYIILKNFSFFGLYKGFFGRLRSLWDIYKWMKKEKDSG